MTSCFNGFLFIFCVAESNFTAYQTATVSPLLRKCQFALSHKMRRSVLTDTRVGRPRSDSDLNHPVTKAADRFRHRVLARLIDRDLGDTFSWEATYDGQILWIEELYDAVKRRPHSPRLQELLYIALRVFRAFVDKLEFYPQKRQDRTHMHRPYRPGTPTNEFGWLGTGESPQRMQGSNPNCPAPCTGKGQRILVVRS